jgi:hypothetical protein
VTTRVFECFWLDAALSKNGDRRAVQVFEDGDEEIDRLDRPPACAAGAL